MRALFGGSFDPVHRGHVALVDHLLETDLVDVIHVVPAAQSPLKSIAQATAHHRLAMVRLAFAEHPEVEIELREIQSGERCYTIETMRSLMKDFPGDRWSLVIGADHVHHFDSWHRFEELLELAHLIVMNRPGCQLDAERWSKIDLKRKVTFVEDFAMTVSASALREQIAAGDLSWHQLVSAGLPENVARYTIEKELYRSLEA